jgi:hypothetical protein
MRRAYQGNAFRKLNVPHSEPCVWNDELIDLIG